MREGEARCRGDASNRIRVSGIDMEWRPREGTCTFEGMPVAMMWVDTTLAGLMSGVQAMVGTERFGLALQAEGRKSVEADWQVISRFPDFREGFRAIANIAAVAGWGDWRLVSLDEDRRECRVRVFDGWEGRYQKALGVCWGSGMLAGKMAGYCTRLFDANCWADQTCFLARGDQYDEVLVSPSSRSVETEIGNLLATDEATRADLAVALRKLEREIVERRRAQEEVQESEERVRRVLASLEVGVVIVDASTRRILSVNPKALALMEASEEQVVGRVCHQFICPAEVDKCPVCDLGKSVDSSERVLLTPGGRRVPVMKSVVRLTLDGRDCLAESFFDISERKRAEAERIGLERQLLDAQRLESLGVLAGGIAHDFNNLLMAILGNLDLSLLELPRTSLARAGIEQAVLATRRAADLTRQLLAYSGRGRFVVARLDLNDLVRENADLFRAAVSRTAVMNLFLAREPVTIEADPGQVQQIVMNLITNASDALGEKTGTITLVSGIVSLERAALGASRLSEKPRPGRFAFLEVSDTGCGMDAGTQQRMFDPFFTTKFTGRGLGMSAVLGIVRCHKGAIMVDSVPGRGTTIRVLFPACEETSAGTAGEAEPEVRSEGSPGFSGTVLVVDDEEAVRVLCENCVRRLGFRVLSAADGEEALAVFARHADEIVCVLLDLTMPRLDGASTFRRLKQLRPEVRVILSSGYDELDVSQRYSQEGIAGFIQKPYLLKDLKKGIERALRGDGSQV
jgi:PAS domain S-box-containing protein